MSNNEIWAAVAGFGGYYEVSTLGRVRVKDRVVFGSSRTLRGRLVSTISHGGRFKEYVGVNLSGGGIRKLKLVHRLVADAFIPRPQWATEINHKNGKKRDNRASNLEWSTGKGNMRHAFDSGLAHGAKGSTNVKAKLTEEQIPMIRTDPRTAHELSRALGISASMVNKIRRRMNWAHVA